MHNFADPVALADPFALAVPLCFIAMVCEKPLQFKNALMRQKALDWSPHALSSSICGREIGTRHFCCILPGGPSVSPFLAAHVGFQIMICQNDCSAVGALSYPPPKVSYFFWGCIGNVDVFSWALEWAIRKLKFAVGHVHAGIDLGYNSLIKTLRMWGLRITYLSDIAFGT